MELAEHLTLYRRAVEAEKTAAARLSWVKSWDNHGRNQAHAELAAAREAIATHGEALVDAQLEAAAARDELRVQATNADPVTRALLMAAIAESERGTRLIAEALELPRAGTAARR